MVIWCVIHHISLRFFKKNTLKVLLKHLNASEDWSRSSKLSFKTFKKITFKYFLQPLKGFIMPF